MVMGVNNSALLTQNTDVSKLSDEFRDGLKLRQEYESRQQQKALNDLMGIQDFNERIAAASQHKYAGALVPAVQQYEEARQKSALDNLKASADINKTYGETGKLNAEAGNIGVQADKTQLDIATGVKDYISAAAVTQNPNVFGLQIGELYKRQLLTQEQTQNLLKLVVSDPASASKVMQAMAMGNPEIAKTFMPKFNTVDGGDKVYGYSVNGFTGEASAPTMQIDKSATPDTVLNAGVSERNNQRTTQASMYSSDNSLKGSMYSSDNSLKGTQYTADTNNATKRLEINQDGQIEWFKAKVSQQNADTNRINAQTTQIKAINPSAGGAGGAGGAKPKPAAVIKMDNGYIQSLKSNAATMKETANWAQKIQSGQLELGAVSNARNALANATGIKAVGNNSAAYAEFNAYVKDLAIKALRLNAGVQTDSDYKRQLDAMISSNYIPRDKDTALALLNKIQRDFATANKGIYESRRNLLANYGETLPEYGQGAKTTQTTARPAAQPQQKVAPTKQVTNTAASKTNAIANKWFN